MTHPVYAAIQRAQALLARPPAELDEFAERVVAGIDAAAAASDPAAAEVVARLLHLANSTRPGAGYRAGVVVAEYLSGEDYTVAEFARRYGPALLRARRALKDERPEPDPEGGYVWSPSTLDAVASAVAITKPAAPLVLVPGGARRG